MAGADDDAPSEGFGSVPKLVTGEDAVLTTAGVVGSVVDVGISSEAGEGTEAVTEDTGLSKLELAFWPASEPPCGLETELMAVASTSSEGATTGSTRLQDAFCDKRAIKAGRKENLWEKRGHKDGL